MLVVVSALVVVLATPRARAHCVATHQVLMMLTPTGTILGPEDDVVVVAVTVTDEGMDGDPRPRPDARSLVLVQGATRIAAVLSPIVPGMWRLLPVTTPPAGTWTIEGLPGSVEYLDTAPGGSAPPLAPDVRTLTYAEQHEGRYTTRSMELSLASDIPGDVVAVAGWWSSAAHVEGGGSWARVTTGTRGATIYAGGGHCDTASPRTSPADPGEHARVAFIDRRGHVSVWVTDVPVRRGRGAH